MMNVHNIFHIFVLRKWVNDLDRRIPKDEVEIRPILSYNEEPNHILPYDVR